MATIQRRESGKWQVQIRRKGHRSLTRSFTDKRTALAWARKIESEQERGLFVDHELAQSTTLEAIFARYIRDVIPRLKAQQQEKSLCRVVGKRLGRLPLSAITASVLSDYRDSRLTQVSATTVRHELSLVQRVLNVCRKDWAIELPQGNPVTQMRLPSPPAGRERRPTPTELKALLSDKIVGRYVALAIETGMRRSEIARIESQHFDHERKVLVIPTSKNGKGRVIPITSMAAQALSVVAQKRLKPHSITQAFDRACKRNGIQGLRFHDLRHEATSRFFELGLNPVEVASITGHRDTRMLMRYTHIKPEILAQRLG